MTLVLIAAAVLAAGFWLVAGGQRPELAAGLQITQVLGTDTFPLRLRAGEEDMAFDLELAPTKPLVLQGEEGLSRKSAEPGSASYYYSYTRLATTGTIRVGDRTHHVRARLSAPLIVLVLVLVLESPRQPPHAPKEPHRADEPR